MSILPPRPLRLDRAALAKANRKVFFLLLLVAGVGLVMAGWGGYAIKLVIDERALWDRGVEGKIVALSGNVRESSKLGITLLYDYDLDVEYLDQQGGAHKGRAEFDLFWTAAREEDPTLRYDPADVSRFVLSSSAEAGFARWGMGGLGLALGGFMAFSCVFIVKNHKKRGRWLALCAEDGEEVLAELVSLTETQGNFSVSYTLDSFGKKQSDALTAPPLVIERSGKQHVVLLRSPRDPESRVLLDGSLFPFEFDAATRQQILERAAKLSAS